MENNPLLDLFNSQFDEPKKDIHPADAFLQRKNRELLTGNAEPIPNPSEEIKEIIKEGFKGFKHNDGTTRVYKELPEFTEESNYSSMPQGLKELQQNNAVHDHGLKVGDKINFDGKDASIKSVVEFESEDKYEVDLGENKSVYTNKAYIERQNPHLNEMGVITIPSDEEVKSAIESINVKSPSENEIVRPVINIGEIPEPTGFDVEAIPIADGQAALFGAFDANRNEFVMAIEGQVQTIDFSPFEDKKKPMELPKDFVCHTEFGINGTATPLLDKALQQSEPSNEMIGSKLVAEYLARPKDEVNMQFVEEMLEVSKYYGNNLIKEKTKLWIGIDPGKSGAIVAVDSDGRIIGKDVIPLLGTDVDAKGIYEILKRYSNEYDITVILEEVHSLHKMAAATNFSMGHTLGIILGIVIASSLRLIRVQPKAWQKEVWITSEIEYLPKKPDQKNASINTKLTSMKAAHRLFPNEDFRKSARSTNDHDGITDSVLLAEYGRRKNL